MSNHRWCCCDPAIDCCQIQSCSNFVTPTQITIDYTGTITRTLSTGQSFVVQDFKYTLVSNSAFVQRGNNCTGDSPREFGCPTALLNYEENQYLWIPMARWQTDIDPLPYACSACDAGMNCNWNGLFCLYRKDRFLGAVRQVGGSNIGTDDCCRPRLVTENPPVIRFLCCDVCGCARPSLWYTPATTVWSTANDFYTIDEDLCCNDNPPPGPQTTGGTYIFPPFLISGACGCPDANTWAHPPGPYAETGCPFPLPVVPGIVGIGFPAVNPCPTPDCKGLPQSVSTFMGGYTFEWQCQQLGPPLVVDFCSETVTYTDTCQHTLTVVIV